MSPGPRSMSPRNCAVLQLYPPQLRQRKVELLTSSHNHPRALLWFLWSSCSASSTWRWTSGWDSPCMSRRYASSAAKISSGKPLRASSGAKPSLCALLVLLSKRAFNDASCSASLASTASSTSAEMASVSVSGNAAHEAPLDSLPSECLKCLQAMKALSGTKQWWETPQLVSDFGYDAAARPMPL